MTVSRDSDTQSYRYHFMYQGKRYVKRGFSNRRAAGIAEGKRREAVALAQASMNLRSWRALVSAYLRESARTKSADWVRQLGWKLDKWTSEWKPLLVERITPAHCLAVLQAVADAGLKPSTVNEYRRTLHAVFAFARRLKVIAENPVDATDKVPEPAGQLPPIPTEHLRRLILASSGALRRQILVQAATGARRVEIARLKPSHLHLDAQPPYVELRTRKRRGGGERIRRQYVSPIAVDALRAQLVEGASAEWVFPSTFGFRGGGRRTPDGMQRHDGASARLARACARAGLPRYGWHAIRRWAGTEVGALGVTDRAIARFLGQTSTAATGQYVWIEDPVMLRASEHLGRLLEAP